MVHRPNINVLSAELQNQIAAGEVVERPSSVVKELIENSLDAQSTEIHIELDGGGQNRILVQDNGYGLSSEDLPKALTRHATSKIEQIEDLNILTSYGFRGEALPSIASVSRLTIGSVLPDASEGFQLTVDFGHIVAQGPTPLSQGTFVSVRDLFRNTPARLKFLKKPATETKRCLDIVHKFGLAHLHCSFTLIANEKNTIFFPKEQSLEERLQRIWPPQITDKLLSIDARHHNFHLCGLLGPPETAQGRADRIIFYVNTRPVQNKMLLSALRQAYKGQLLSREYPQAVLFLSIPPEEVDINVHPAKAEVRFRNEQDIFSFLHQRIKAALSSSTSASFSVPKEESDQADKPLHQYSFHTLEDMNLSSLQETETAEYPTSKKQFSWSQPQEGDLSSHDHVFIHPCQETGASSPDKTAHLIYLGQISHCYLLLKDRQEELILMDQHAAHERILYHHFKTTGENAPQQLLAPPLDLHLHPAEQSRLEHIGPMLRHLGFSYTMDHPSMMTVQALPGALTWQQGKAFLKSALGKHIETLDALWSLMACRQAIKCGQTLARDEALHLIETWLKTPERDFCPHGRPVTVRLTSYDLEKMFKRHQ
jgi:DNA mismatch repair protein MutL